MVKVLRLDTENGEMKMEVTSFRIIFKSNNMQDWLFKRDSQLKNRGARVCKIIDNEEFGNISLEYTDGEILRFTYDQIVSIKYSLEWVYRA